MAKTQLNIKIEEDLLGKVKYQARSNGKTVTQYIIDIINLSINKVSINKESEFVPGYQIKDLDRRLKMIESNIDSITISYQQKNKYTKVDAINISNYIRKLFNDNIKRKFNNNKKEAWGNFITHSYLKKQINEFAILRLKELVFNENLDVLLETELNDQEQIGGNLMDILSSLISWADISDQPSLNSICQIGEDLL